jgi:isoprene-epoxide---glutathione S-transferase
MVTQQVDETAAKSAGPSVLTVYGYVPAWGVPDISPYVTKLVYYLHMAGVEHEWKPQSLATLDEDSPNGKLPYIVEPDGTKTTDSNRIIFYLESKSPAPLDAGMTGPEQAQALAWHRLLEEHLYWSGVIQPRWREDAGWETYIPYIVQGAEVTPEVRAGLDGFRARIMAEFNGQGMGRRTDEEVFEVFREDVDALSTYLGEKPFFLGETPRTLDASVYSFIRHLTDVPFEWPGRDYARGKQNLVAYADRMRERFGV